MTDADKKLYDKAVEALDQMGAGLPSEIEKYVPAWIDGYKEGLKVKINATTISDCPIKDEWQYVSEKGTPKTEGHYLVCLRNKDKDILDCWILYDKDVGWYSMQIRMKDIYAWKEIVPPELPKEIAE